MNLQELSKIADSFTRREFRSLDEFKHWLKSSEITELSYEDLKRSKSFEYPFKIEDQPFSLYLYRNANGQVVTYLRHVTNHGTDTVFEDTVDDKNPYSDPAYLDDVLACVEEAFYISDSTK